MLEDTANTQTKDGGEASPVFHPINKVQCVAFADTKERTKNIKWALNKNFPRLNEVVFNQTADLAIVGGGPTLNETYKDILPSMHVMTCGSTHDHAVRLGIKPTYHIECDPMLTQKNQYKEHPKDVTYLVASRCHKSLFQHLKDRKIRLWHMWEQDLGKPLYNGEPAYICGATVVLAAIPVALSMGYKSFHFFGVDGSFESEEEHHAYPQDEYSQIMMAKVGDPKNGKSYKTTATWIGQAQQFEDMQNNWGHMFTVKIYGDSMMAAMQQCRMRDMVARNGSLK